MTIFCPFCGEKLVDEAKFCKNCGKNIEDYRKHEDDSTNAYDYQPPVAENSHTLAAVLGFICSVFVPLLGLIFGIYMYTRKDSSKAKTYGILMIAISLLVWIISAIVSFWMY